MLFNNFECFSIFLYKVMSIYYEFLILIWFGWDGSLLVVVFDFLLYICFYYKNGYV